MTNLVFALACAPFVGYLGVIIYQSWRARKAPRHWR